MNWPGEDVLNRLIETIEKGVGGIAKPWQIRREGKANAEARAHEMILLAQAEKEVQAIRSGQKALDQSGKLISVPPRLMLEAPSPGTSSTTPTQRSADFVDLFATAAVSVDVADAMQRSINLKRISLFAEEEAEAAASRPKPDNAKPAEAHIPDDDWFARWRTGAQSVQREEMQRLWGRLLAGEVAVPGSYSLHTIDFLSRMSAKDAALLEQVAPYATSGGLVKEASSVWGSSGIEFSHLLYLDDLGLLNGASSGVGGLVFTPALNEWQGRKYRIIYAGKAALIFEFGPEHEADTEFEFGCYPLTLVGREILSLANIDANEEYLKRIAEIGVQKGAKKVSRGVRIPGNEYIYSVEEFFIPAHVKSK